MVDGEVLSLVVARTNQLSTLSGDEDTLQKGHFGNVTFFGTSDAERVPFAYAKMSAQDHA